MVFLFGYIYNLYMFYCYLDSPCRKPLLWYLQRRMCHYLDNAIHFHGILVHLQRIYN